MQDLYFYFALGWEHIISAGALDHQLFILALVAVYTFADIKKVLILVTAFTIGHSLTLVLSVLDVFRFDSKWVEFLIPCTIFITALNNLFNLKAASNGKARSNYYLALGFGLIHGMGFANAIRVMLAKDQALGWGLFGFNVGLEAGQIVVVAVLLTVTMLVLQFSKIKRRDWVFFLSAGVFALTLQMALERLPF
ncbi:HupE/UreJ family protein [Mucilaginibacter sp. JRF]|uniref:HupE/UreJ family protein n=1 Tax=Mucilaginibacter sp. JRF TaxID=2780088 RepID=UPI001880743D|nr:HupE/UreJ family protein [Mucilaginibacter sp. JRF]MBE9583588.1 HupE/UreJ family protein [Mucilaginibacter sp. JRF]